MAKTQHNQTSSSSKYSSFTKESVSEIQFAEEDDNNGENKAYCQTNNTQQTQEEWEVDYQRVVERFQNAAFRGAVLGMVLKGGLILLGQSLKSFKQHKAKDQNISLMDAVKQSVEYGLFMGTIGGGFVAADEGLRIIVGDQSSQLWRSFIGGCCVGPSLMLLGLSERHDALATYIFVRALTLAIRVGNKHPNPILHKLLQPTRWEHGDIALMCLSCSQILYAFVMQPSSLPKSYIRFLNKMLNKPPEVVPEIRKLMLNQQKEFVKACDVVHPQMSCAQHAIGVAPSSFALSMKVYLPVYMVPAIVVHRKKLLKTPLSILLKVLLGSCRSSAFLTILIVQCFTLLCSTHQAMKGRSSQLIFPLVLWAGGLATFVEKKSRRMELALYCSSRVLESFSKCLVEWGCVPKRISNLRIDVLIFSIACGVIMQCYSGCNGAHRDVFRSKYLNVLDFVFGNTGHKQGMIRHVPSTADIINQWEQQARLRIKQFSRTHLSDLDNNSTFSDTD